jgi:hypothetical protein
MTTLLQQARLALELHRLSRPIKPFRATEPRYIANLAARDSPGKAFGKDQRREVEEYEAYRAARKVYDAKRRELVAAFIAISTPSDLE